MKADDYFDINLLFDERRPLCNNHGYKTNQRKVRSNLRPSTRRATEGEAATEAFENVCED